MWETPSGPNLPYNTDAPLAFGQSLHIDVYGVARMLCDDIGFFYSLLDDLTAKLGMHKQAPPFVFRSPEAQFPDKAGLSGWVPLIESGISVHTLTLKGFVSLDIYTCGMLDIDYTAGYLRERLGASHFELQHLIRGSKYHDLPEDSPKLAPRAGED